LEGLGPELAKQATKAGIQRDQQSTHTAIWGPMQRSVQGRDLVRSPEHATPNVTNKAHRQAHGKASP